jgi:glycosyltransferase involved in cell wall biosynthesis
MAEWLPVALESCLWQTWRDLEIIVLDDGSTDAGPDIARAYAAADSRIRLISQANAGLGAAWQAGQNAAAGDYITWLDADDFLDPEAAAAWMEQAGRDGADMVCANAVAFSHRTFNARRYFYHPAASGLTFDRSPAYWKSKVVWRWIFSLPFLREGGIAHPSYKLGQDVCFMYACLLRARHFSQVGPYVYYFRQDHKNAQSSVRVRSTSWPIFLR